MKPMRPAVVDLLALGGAVALTYGAALLTPAFGWITGGGLALVGAILWTKYTPGGTRR